MEIQKGFILGLLLIPAWVCAAGESIEKWAVQKYWDMLEVKKTDAVVIELLGRPREIETVNNTQIWYYQQAPQRQEGAVVSRPRCGLLRFRSNDSVCLLIDWKEPDWSVSAPHTEAQYLSEQQRVEQQIKAEEARRLRQEHQAQREQNRAQQETARQKAAEEARQSNLAQTNLTQQQLAETPAVRQDPQSEKPLGFSLNNGHTKYWFSVAALFIVMAISISITYGFKK